MNKIIEFLKGKKTYITAILFAVYNVGLAVGWWTADNNTILVVNTILGSLGFGFLRAGAKK